MSKKTSDTKYPIRELDAEQMKNLYSTLGQVLDGIWFLETETRIGYEKTLEIDLAVWEKFAANETRRILSVLIPDPESCSQYPIDFIFQLLEQVLRISVFNQSIQYEIERVENEPALLFKVTDCKTLKGMAKVGRSLNQAQRICKEIGLAYYENMIKVLHPDLKVECVTIPSSYDIPDTLPRCAWKLYFEQ